MAVILRKNEGVLSDEFNLILRRILPCNQIPAPNGAAWGILKAGKTTPEDCHDEHEIFFILAGHGELAVDHEMNVVGVGDVIYLPPFCRHTLHNPTGSVDLQLLTIWWGGAAAEMGAAAGIGVAQ